MGGEEVTAQHSPTPRPNPSPAPWGGQSLRFRWLNHVEVDKICCNHWTNWLMLYRVLYYISS